MERFGNSITNEEDGPSDLLLRRIRLHKYFVTVMSSRNNYLSEQERQLVALAYFRGHTHSELATITGLPIGTVKTRLHRTMIKLRELVADGDNLSDTSDE